MNNLHTQWKPGFFVDQPQYRHWSDDQKAKADREERRRVRPYPTANAIAVCPSPEEAKWVAERLNLAAKLEQMTYDYAMGKTDGSEIVDLVRSHVDA